MYCGSGVSFKTGNKGEVRRRRVDAAPMQPDTAGRDITTHLNPLSILLLEADHLDSSLLLEVPEIHCLLARRSQDGSPTVPILVGPIDSCAKGNTAGRRSYRPIVSEMAPW
jgi:hypothetical protein